MPNFYRCRDDHGHDPLEFCEISVVVVRPNSIASLISVTISRSFHFLFRPWYSIVATKWEGSRISCKGLVGSGFLDIMQQDCACALCFSFTYQLPLFYFIFIFSALLFSASVFMSSCWAEFMLHLFPLFPVVVGSSVCYSYIISFFFEFLTGSL